MIKKILFLSIVFVIIFIAVFFRENPSEDSQTKKSTKEKETIQENIGSIILERPPFLDN